jgi:branched-chain amino acid transport system substrate-binding protein
MNKQSLLTVLAAATLALGAGVPAAAQDTVKIGLILPMTGPFASTGRQIDTAVKVYMAKHGSTVAGKKIEVIVKDDAGTADTTRRLAQELVVNDKVAFLAGFGLTPTAFATAPIATQGKVPMIVMAAATSAVTEQSPFIVRSGFTLPQITLPIAEWAAKNNLKKVVTLVTDYGPGIDAENQFKKTFTAAGGTVSAELRVPLRNPDFAPFLQRVRDASPDAVFVFVPSGVGSIFMKQFAERGLDKSGIKLIATGDVTDDDILNDMGDVALGVVNSMHYSAAHNSAMNKEYVAAMRKAANLRANFHSVGGYDGMHLIYKALEATKGNTSGEALVEAMKGMAWESPRGPMSIDRETRDVIQNVYIRRVERGADGQLWNVEFQTVTAVKDPGKQK